MRVSGMFPSHALCLPLAPFPLPITSLLPLLAPPKRNAAAVAPSAPTPAPTAPPPLEPEKPAAPAGERRTLGGRETTVKRTPEVSAQCALPLTRAPPCQVASAPGQLSRSKNKRTQVVPPYLDSANLATAATTLWHRLKQTRAWRRKPRQR